MNLSHDGVFFIITQISESSRETLNGPLRISSANTEPSSGSSSSNQLVINTCAYD